MRSVAISDLRVLLVEPSAVQQRIIRRMLGAAGLQHVRGARSGREALDEVRQRPCDLVISAMYLPDMTGADVILELRGDEHLYDMPFVLVTSEREGKRLESIRQAGPSAILPKPFEQTDLDDALQATIAYINAGVTDDSVAEFEGLQVLVVDDTAVARTFIVRTLRRLGISHIVEAGDGAEAVARLDDQIFDLVVTDYTMPRMDGRELAAFIRQHSPQRDVPIILVTSEDDPTRLAAARAAGVSAVCDKPFQITDIQQLIGQLVSS